MTWLSSRGMVRPTVSVRCCRVSPFRVMVDTGEVSVMP